MGAVWPLAPLLSSITRLSLEVPCIGSDLDDGGDGNGGGVDAAAVCIFGSLAALIRLRQLRLKLCARLPVSRAALLSLRSLTQLRVLSISSIQPVSDDDDKYDDTDPSALLCAMPRLRTLMLLLPESD